ncbi:unnamed protein product [Prunus armeniaca]
MHQNKISLQSSSLRSPLLLHEFRPSERTKSGRNHPSPAAGKKARSDSTPSSRLCPKGARLSLLEGSWVSSSNLPFFFSSWCIQGHPLGFSMSSVDAFSVGASKEMPTPVL